MKNIISIFLFGILFVSGCATSYHKAGFSGGYSDLMMGEDTCRVTFYGNGYTNVERAYDFAWLRAAEITIQRGYLYFTILNQNSEMKQESYTTPASSYTTVTGYGNHYSAYTTYDPGQTYNFNKPQSSFVIKMFKERPVGAYTAVDIEKNIRAQYKIK